MNGALSTFAAAQNKLRFFFEKKPVTDQTLPIPEVAASSWFKSLLLFRVQPKTGL
jgi:hypothetical protein